LSLSSGETTDGDLQLDARSGSASVHESDGESIEDSEGDIIALRVGLEPKL